jgi:hypothetical protein
MIEIQGKIQRHRIRNFSVPHSNPDFRILSDPNLLVRIAGESLATSAPELEAERYQQIALGLQQLAPNHEPPCKPKVTLQRHPKTTAKSGPIIQDFRGAGILQVLRRLSDES